MKHSGRTEVELISIDVCLRPSTAVSSLLADFWASIETPSAASPFTPFPHVSIQVSPQEVGQIGGQGLALAIVQ